MIRFNLRANPLDAGSPLPAQTPKEESSKHRVPVRNDRGEGETGVRKHHKFFEQHSPGVSTVYVTSISPEIKDPT